MDLADPLSTMFWKMDFAMFKGRWIKAKCIPCQPGCKCKVTSALYDQDLTTATFTYTVEDQSNIWETWVENGARCYGKDKDTRFPDVVAWLSDIAAALGTVLPPFSPKNDLYLAPLWWQDHERSRDSSPTPTKKYTATHAASKGPGPRRYTTPPLDDIDRMDWTSARLQSVYYEDDLAEYCRRNGIRLTGSKRVLANRIMTFKKTGKRG